MIRHIAPDVERLMWLIAEERDPKAISEFEERFPDLKYELSKRISMVQSLKSAGKQVRRHDVPRFVPRNAAPEPWFRPAYVAFAVVLAAFAFGAYSVTAYLGRPAPKLPPIQRVNTSEPQAPTDIMPIPGNEGMNPITVPHTDTAPPQTDRPTFPASNDPLQRPVTLKVENATLEAAILMVCNQAGLTYEIAPGLAQETVTLDYQGVPANQILSDLGAKYGFTALPQDMGKVLVIPARPTGSPAQGNHEPETSGAQ